MRELSHVISKVTQWHHDRGLVDGSTDEAQLGKLFEEFTELFAAVHAGKSEGVVCDELQVSLDKLYTQRKIKPVKPEDRPMAFEDAIGDMLVVLINLCERNGTSLETCLNHAYGEIKDRSGRMVNGVFEKDAA